MRVGPAIWIPTLILLLGHITACTAQSTVSANDASRIRPLLEAIQNGTEDAQASALYQLATLHLPAAKAVPIFSGHLRRTTGTLSEALGIAHAVNGLADYGVLAKSALPALVRLADDVERPEALRSSSLQIWWPVTHALATIWPGNIEAILALDRAIQRGMDNPRLYADMATEAATALGDMGPSAREARLKLMVAIYRYSASNAWAMARALARVTAGTDGAVEPIIRAIESGKTPDLMAGILGEIGRPAALALPTLHRLLNSAQLPVSMAAFAAIASISTPAIPDADQALACLRSLDRLNASGSYAAFAALRKPGARAAEASELLAKIYRSHNEIYLRRTALETLAAIGPHGSIDAARILAKAAGKADPINIIGMKPTMALAGFGREDGSDAVKALIPLLTDSGAVDAAISALIRIGPAAGPTVPALVRTLRDEPAREPLPNRSLLSIEALGNIGPMASEASGIVSELLLKISLNSRPVDSLSISTGRVAILWALAQIGVPISTIPALRQSLLENDAPVFAAAAHAAGMLGVQAAGLEPELTRALRSDFNDPALTRNFQCGYVAETTARMEAIRALGRIGRGAAAAIPQLEAIAAQSDADGHNTAFGRLDFGAAARQAVSAIRADQVK